MTNENQMAFEWLRFLSTILFMMFINLSLCSLLYLTVHKQNSNVFKNNLENYTKSYYFSSIHFLIIEIIIKMITCNYTLCRKIWYGVNVWYSSKFTICIPYYSPWVQVPAPLLIPLHANLHFG